MSIIIIAVILCLVLFYVISAYNRLIRLQNLTKESWSGIDVQLKQRANLIPNLVETVKGYMGHESSVLEKVTALRNQCLTTNTIHDRSEKENQLTEALKHIFALSENYPDLKASQNFIELQRSLENIENQLQLSRRYYNGTVRDLNISIQSFPSNVIALGFSFKPAEFFEIEEAKERDAPTIKLTQ